MSQSTLLGKTDYDFAELLKSYDVREFIHYLAKCNTLSKSEQEFIKTLKNKKQIICRLNQLKSADQQFGQESLTALNEFAIQASKRVQVFYHRTPETSRTDQLQLCNRKKVFAKEQTPDEESVRQEFQEKKESTSPASSSSDDSEDTVDLNQYSQQCHVS